MTCSPEHYHCVISRVKQKTNCHPGAFQQLLFIRICQSLRERFFEINVACTSHILANLFWCGYLSAQGIVKADGYQRETLQALLWLNCFLLLVWLRTLWRQLNQTQFFCHLFIYHLKDLLRICLGSFTAYGWRCWDSDFSIRCGIFKKTPNTKETRVNFSFCYVSIHVVEYNESTFTRYTEKNINK